MMDTWTQQMGFPIITLERDNGSSEYQPSSRHKRMASAQWSALKPHLSRIFWHCVSNRCMTQDKYRAGANIAGGGSSDSSQRPAWWELNQSKTAFLPGLSLCSLSLTSPTANLKISLCQKLRRLAGIYLFFYYSQMCELDQPFQLWPSKRHKLGKSESWRQWILQG